MEKENRRYFIELAFKGTEYHGWQVQKNAIGVQKLVDEALSKVFREEIHTIGCGRTDTGVHAKQLFAHFDIVNAALEIRNEQFLKRINALLPFDIVIKELFEVKSGAHARFDAISRSYDYYIHFEKDPFLRDYSWQIRDVPDLEKMNRAASIMMEYHDFSCFSKSNTQVRTNICEIKFAEWAWLDEKRLVFHITANRFLRNMVRAIVGTLIEIGQGKQEIDFIREVLASKSRSMAGVSVPACGLFLSEVIYPDIRKN